MFPVEAVNVRLPLPHVSPPLTASATVMGVVVTVADADLAQPEASVTVPVKTVVAVIGPTVKSWQVSVVGPKLCPARVYVNGPKLASLVVHSRRVVVLPHGAGQLVAGCSRWLGRRAVMVTGRKRDCLLPK